MERPSITKGVAITIVLVAGCAHVAALFLDGLMIARTQQQLAVDIAKQPEQYLQLASDPLYQPLFRSYSREIALLDEVAKTREQKNDKELAKLVTRTKLNLNPLFRNLLKAEDEGEQQNAIRALFVQLARPAIDAKTASIYQYGRKLMLSMGVELPELKSS